MRLSVSRGQAVRRNVVPSNHKEQDKSGCEVNPLWLNTLQHQYTIRTLWVALIGWGNSTVCLRCVISFSVCFTLCLLSFFCLSLSYMLSFSAFRAEGTSEGSGWLSLLEADGRPKARRPQFHEAWFEHARIMSRGMPMDDGWVVCLRECFCVSEHLGEAG